MLTPDRYSLMALLSSVFYLAISSSTSATLLNLPDIPLNVDGSKTALVQLVVARDHKLFFEAYPTYVDINGDGVLDNKFKPEEIDYYGYFGSDYCYTHTGTYFTASSLAIDKKCTADTDSWSGDFLNYATMSRMDIMLRALYGGKRLVDTDSQTILRRAFVPWTFHTWGMEYESESTDGYKISDYTPLSEPNSGRRHHLATNNYVSRSDTPHLRIRTNSNGRIWDWIDKGGVQGNGSANQNLIVDVEVCKTGFVEDTCSLYPNGNYKPTGLLHTYGENNAMYFSLLTGSYENNLQGGVLRKTMSSFADEIDSDTGVFISTNGIVHTLDSIQIPNNFKGTTSVMLDCLWISNRTMVNGECSAWGNPVAEMMYEGMRYLAGEGTPTPMFYDDAAASDSIDNELGLPTATWDDPYDSAQPYGQCSTAHQLVISDASTSHDSDQLPGNFFEDFSNSSLGSLNVGSSADFISGNESSLPGLKFIGETDLVADRAPTAKMVNTFKTIRGQAPEEPHRGGSYYASSVAYYGNQTDIHTGVSGDQTVGNFTLALGSSLPTIEVEVGGQIVNIVPFGQTVDTWGGCGAVDRTLFAPISPIIAFEVEEVTDSTGSFRVSFENIEQGHNNDNDAIARYEYEVLSSTELEVTITSIEASGCAVQHLGYSISGTTADGLYLAVRDSGVSVAREVDYELDVPPGEFPGSANWNDGDPLPKSNSRTFTPSSTPAAQALESPLWYAAKWGGFNDANGDGVPQTAEWDGDGDGNPDNYFEATDASRLADTLGNVFDSISGANNSIAAVSVTGSSLTSNSRIYESTFNTGEWYSELSSRAIDGYGNLADDIDWEVNTELRKQVAANSRTILTYKPSLGTGIAFRWLADSTEPVEQHMDQEQVDALSLHPVSGLTDEFAGTRVWHLRGNFVDGYRTRTEPLGDIVNSAAQFVGAPESYYPDDWGTGEPESSEPYSEFAEKYAQRQRAIFVGANDGMLHAFNAGEYDTATGSYDVGDGSEIFAYVPSPVYENLPTLSHPDYSHKFYVDATPTIADAFIKGEWRTILVGGLGKGGQGVYALDVTDVGNVTENNANEAVLWEFTEKDDAHMGYSYTSPLITRMNNGRWVAIFGNGYNAREADGYQASNAKGAIFIVDLETGELIKKMVTHDGSNARPNGINAPTAVDLDFDNIVDIIYATDLRGVLGKYNVSSNDSDDWGRISDQMFYTVDRTGRRNEANSEPVTTQMAVGSHPTGEGVLLYLATGKYLEPEDLSNNGDLHKIYALWDKDPFTDPNLRGKFPGRFLQQSITSEQTIYYDTDGDGIDDSSAFVRESTQHEINWDTHLGWYMDLEYINSTGERVVAEPVLREGKILFNTYIPTGDECNPDASGWLMILDAASGAMPETSVDINGDGVFTAPDETVAGVNSISNPFTAPNVASGTAEDVLLTSSTDGTGTSSVTLDSTGVRGRVSWRELEP